MKYRRVYISGGTYFYTLVTYHRRAIFTSQKSIDLLAKAFDYVKARMPFEIVAGVILPDHLHYIWTLPQDDSDFSTRWRLIKGRFTHSSDQTDALQISASRIKKNEKDIWQRRFWEHLIRDEDDLRRHIEYIHFNPVKHGLAESPKDWKWSSFIEYVNDGFYPLDWAETGQSWKGESYLE